MYSELYRRIISEWKNLDFSSESSLEANLENYRVLFAYHSGKIENPDISYHTTREIFCNGKVSSFSGDPKSIFEQQNQKTCYDYLKGLIIRKEPLSIDLIKEVHRILTSGTYDAERYINNGERPGEFKTHDYVIGKEDSGTAPDMVEAEITDLINELNSYTGEDYLSVAAYFHAVFENIHPFADGNGRTGRTLTNYYLMIKGFPPLIVFNEDKNIYYDCLDKYDREEDIASLKQFFEYETEKTWESSLLKSNNRRKKLDDYIR